MLEESYKNWLEREGYQPRTLATSIASTRSAERAWEKASKISLTQGAADSIDSMLIDSAIAPYRSLLKRYSRFLHSVPFPRWGVFERFVVDNFEAAKPQLHGNLTKSPLTSTQWRNLIALLSDGEEPADDVLLIIMAHLPELEPRKILAMTVKSFDPQLEALFARVKKARVRHLWEFVSPTPYGAFARVQRRLKKHAEALGAEIDFHAIAKTPAEVRNGGIR